VEPTPARETNDNDKIRSQQKPGQQKEKEQESKKLGQQKERKQESKKAGWQKAGGGQQKFPLILLPNETLHHLFSFLQPIDLRAVAQTCSRLSEVCESLFPTRGCVAPVWERRRGVGQRRMRYNWVEARRKWSFSASIGRVAHWEDIGEGQLQQHLAKCRFYQLEECRQEVPLMPGLKDELEKRVALKKSSQWFIQ